MIRPDDDRGFEGPRIAAVGVGGGGGNAVSALLRRGISGVDALILNTDAQALHKSDVTQRFQLGREVTRGLGAGADPEVGRQAALDDRERIAELVAGRDMVFVLVGLGGGTGTGAAPVVAEVCREAGALTVGVATTPFKFEGRRRARTAADGLTRFREQVDTLITLPNDRLLSVVDESTPMTRAFAAVDDVVGQGVRALSQLVHGAGQVNVDFADVRTIMQDRGDALLGVGSGTGKHRAARAAQAAFSSPLLQDTPLLGARHILLNLAGPPDLTLREVDEAATLIGDEAHDDVNLIWGWVTDPALEDRVEVTLIATGFDDAGSSWSPKATRADKSKPSSRRPQASDYDIPSFFRNAD